MELTNVVGLTSVRGAAASGFGIKDIFSRWYIVVYTEENGSIERDIVK
jgi:hypothetical protein